MIFYTSTTLAFTPITELNEEQIYSEKVYLHNLIFSISNAYDAYNNLRGYIEHNGPENKVIEHMNTLDITLKNMKIPPQYPLPNTVDDRLDVFVTLYDGTQNIIIEEKHYLEVAKICHSDKEHLEELKNCSNRINKKNKELKNLFEDYFLVK